MIKNFIIERLYKKPYEKRGGKISENSYEIQNPAKREQARVYDVFDIGARQFLFY